MEQSLSKCAAAAPFTLQRLLDTQQATAVLPGALYFATTGECLSSCIVTASAPSSSPAPAASSSGVGSAGDTCISTKPSSSPLAAALRDFFLKENSWRETDDAQAAEAVRTLPSTNAAAVGADAVFVAPRGAPPYVYRPFFADFGPLDVGCCVHFARRLRELLRAVSQTDPAAAATRTATTSPDTAAAAAGSNSSGSTPATLPVVVCTSLNAQERVNTACLVGAFCVLVLGWSTTATWSRVFADVYPSFLTYRDASTGVSNYPLSLQDVWSGLEQAARLGWVDIDAFDLAAYWAGKSQDYSWIVPRRLLAMSSPRDVDPLRTAEVVAPRLRAMNVRLVIRLNDDLYNPSPLLRLGIRHVDLPYEDGSTPNDATLLQFLQAVEEHFGEQVVASSLRQWWSVPTVVGLTGAKHEKNSTKTTSATMTRNNNSNNNSSNGTRRHRHHSGEGRVEPHYAPCSLLHSGKYRGMPDTRTAVPPALTNSTTTVPAGGELGAVAVHCLAGLGRTGTMIAVYVMRHYGFTARGVIGWMRLCRPGSITGVQQQYLDTIERRLRPSPYVFAAQKLKDFVQTLHTASPRSLSPSSASAAALSDTDPARNVTPAGRAHGVAVAAVTPAGTAAFQIHGNVVGDARPLTGMGSNSSSNGGEGEQRREIPWSGGPDGPLLRQSPLQPQQQQQRRRSSTSSLSFSADHPDNTALDAVSSMPMLGGAANDRLRSLNHRSNNSTTLAAPPATFPSDFFSDNLGNGTLNAATVRALPRARDYKYASTYFVALERANRRSPASSRTTNSSGRNNSNTTNLPATSPSRPSYGARGKPSSANPTTRPAGSSNTTRAATASTTFARRSSRLDSLRLPPAVAPPQLQHHHRISIGSTGGGPDPLSRDQSFGRNPSFPFHQRASVASVTAHGGNDGAAAAGRDVSFGSVVTSTVDDADAVVVDRPRPFTTTALRSAGSDTLERSRDLHTRLRKRPQKPGRAEQPGRRHPSFRSSFSQAEFSWKEEEEASPAYTSPAPPASRTEEPQRTADMRGVPKCGLADGAARSPSPRAAAIPETVLPLWGRHIGHV